ncbi:hypothetical protein SAPIO_CDS5164 [Scedosporium apiospermum]|uniref:PITH domain-containing protein n=1 Tax=Pseudallescheria apiosperma TaxID=563466 RepID=A0A084G6W7_PSEDA|nr:uncharacterized protein SAPIO_CDS5164 [Scedosporium apiospermum]KEZ43079.1 hypothetical protein SAPIO_CDS5164 [Scedosporium apiospermum]
MSHHCHDEHHDHGGHGHDHGAHDHSDDITPALQFSLYQHINFDEIVTFNEARFGMGRDVVKKTWAERLNNEPELESDADEQLIMNVPFTGQVKLHSISLRTSNSPSAPKTLKVFVNRDKLDFSTAEEAEATQTFELSLTSDVQELPVKRALFGKVRRLSLFFVDNFSEGEEDVSRIAYVGFKGEWMQLGRAPANILYEAAANPSDHEVKGVGVNKMGYGIGGGGRGSGF